MEQGAERGGLALARRFWRQLAASRLFGLAAEMAFWLFLSLLPLAAVAGLVTAKFAWGNPATIAPLLASLPKATRELVSSELGHVAAWNAGSVSIGAGLMFVWLASSGVHSIFDGIESGVECEAAPRPWWKKRLLAFGTCVALSLGVALLALLGTGVGWMWHFVDGSAWLHAFDLESGVLGRGARRVAGAALSFALISGLYAVALPPRARRSLPIVPGALLAVALQTAIGFGFRFYIKHVGDGGAYQAGLASIAVTLMALYLTCLVLLFGVEVNVMIGRVRSERAPASGSDPGPGPLPPRPSRCEQDGAADRGRA